MAVIFLIGLVVSVIGILFNPFIGLYAFTIALYIKPGIFSVFLALARPNMLVGVLTLLMIFLHKQKKDGIVFFKAAPSRWFLAVGIVMGLSMITSIWRGNTQEFIMNFFKVYVAYFLVINLVSSVSRFRAVIWSMVLSMVYIGVVSIQEYYVSGAAWAGERMFGAFQGALFGDPNDMALGFTMLIPFLYFDLFRKGGLLRKATQLGIIALFLWGIVLTQSRGGFVGLLTMLVILWLKNKYKVRLAIIGIIVLAIGWQIAPSSFRERILTIETAGEEDAAAISRKNSWEAGFNMMKGRVFGVGAGNFGEGFVQYRPSGAVDFPGMRRVAHNMFIHVGGETGFPGFIVFIGMIVSAFRSLSRLKKRAQEQKNTRAQEHAEIGLLADATFVSLAGYCASGMFLSQAYNFVLYYLIAFSVVLLRMAGDEGLGIKDKGSRVRIQKDNKEKPWKSRAMAGQLEKRQG
jgi:probable O-glycosylation ligase (exosortase A-associated)